MGIIIPIMGIHTRRSKSDEPELSIADALFNHARQRVLGVLFGIPSRTFFANEIIKLAASGSGAVQRELARLKSAGLITVQRVGNQTHYQANSLSPVFTELRSLVLKTSGLADQLRVALDPRERDIVAAFVYGSVAKRKDTTSSDIDLMVVSNDVTYAEIFLLLEDVSRALGRSINPTVYSQAEFAQRVHKRNAFVTRVLQQPKIWLIGAENDIAD
jgi:predicted nucleotidyltransferase